MHLHGHRKRATRVAKAERPPRDFRIENLTAGQTLSQNVGLLTYNRRATRRCCCLRTSSPKPTTA